VVLIFGAAGAVVDGQVLYRLHEDYARDTVETPIQTADDWLAGKAARRDL